jgi:serpin B
MQYFIISGFYSVEMIKFARNMKKNVLWVAVALMMAIGFGACSNDDSVTPDEPLSNEDNDRKEISLTRSDQELVNSNNDFAFNLFRKMALRLSDGECSTCYMGPEKSQIVSPISITYALGMLNNGAAGETQAEINKVLGFGKTGADGINAFCRKMLTEAPKLDKLTKVMIANTIYMNKGYELKPDFVSKANAFYDATPETRDFADGKTRDVINKWGSDHTEGMIPEVLKEEEFNPGAVSYLLNAIYFKGAWTEKFDKDNTTDETFKGYNTETQVPMMHQENEFNYTESDDCQALRLPYGNKAYTMTILLPKEGKTISDVLVSLTAENWQRYQRMGNAKVDVKLPRFESKTDVDLTTIMSALGMPRAFDDRLAEFPNFCNDPTYIGLMKQVARIKLNEEGTEAAAVTVVEMDFKSASVSQRVEFHATRPFLYVISEQSTGAIFFIGQYLGD